MLLLLPLLQEVLLVLRLLVLQQHAGLVLGESLLNETSTPPDVLADQTHIASASAATEAGCSPTRRPSP